MYCLAVGKLWNISFIRNIFVTITVTIIVVKVVTFKRSFPSVALAITCSKSRRLLLGVSPSITVIDSHCTYYNDFTCSLEWGSWGRQRFHTCLYVEASLKQKQHNRRILTILTLFIWKCFENWLSEYWLNCVKTNCYLLPTRGFCALTHLLYMLYMLLSSKMDWPSM